MSQHTDQPGTVDSMFNLAGKVALVTGGAVGMGRAAGLVLAAACATVILADDPGRIEALGGLPPLARATAMDVTSEQSVNAVVAGIGAKEGGIDILVCGAVINHNKALTEISAAEWDQVQAVNLKGAFLTAKAVIPLMRQRGGGRIIMISTIGSVHPVLHGNSAYSASRAGLNQFTRILALDYAADHVTANAILAGAIHTETLPSDFRPTGPGADPARHIGGFGKPEDIAGLVLLLAGPAGRFITGQSIAVDGGFLVS